MLIDFDADAQDVIDAFLDILLELNELKLHIENDPLPGQPEIVEGIDQIGDYLGQCITFLYGD
jgi:hypothetical protein